MIDIPCHNMLMARDKIRKQTDSIRDIYSHPETLIDDSFIVANVSIKLNALRDEILSNELCLYQEDAEKIKKSYDRHLSKDSAFSHDIINCVHRHGPNLNIEDCMLDEMLDLFQDEADEILLKGVCRCMHDPPKTSFVGKYSEEANKRMENKFFNYPEHEKI